MKLNVDSLKRLNVAVAISLILFVVLSIIGVNIVNSFAVEDELEQKKAQEFLQAPITEEEQALIDSVGDGKTINVTGTIQIEDYNRLLNHGSDHWFDKVDVTIYYIDNSEVKTATSQTSSSDGNFSFSIPAPTRFYIKAVYSFTYPDYGPSSNTRYTAYYNFADTLTDSNLGLISIEIPDPTALISIVQINRSHVALVNDLNAGTIVYTKNSEASITGSGVCFDYRSSWSDADYNWYDIVLSVDGSTLSYNTPYDTYKLVAEPKPGYEFAGWYKPLLYSVGAVSSEEEQTIAYPKSKQLVRISTGDFAGDSDFTNLTTSQNVNIVDPGAGEYFFSNGYFIPYVAVFRETNKNSKCYTVNINVDSSDSNVYIKGSNGNTDLKEVSFKTNEIVYDSASFPFLLRDLSVFGQDNVIALQGGDISWITHNSSSQRSALFDNDAPCYIFEAFSTDPTREFTGWNIQTAGGETIDDISSAIEISDNLTITPVFTNGTAEKNSISSTVCYTGGSEHPEFTDLVFESEGHETTFATALDDGEFTIQTLGAGTLYVYANGAKVKTVEITEDDIAEGTIDTIYVDAPTKAVKLYGWTYSLAQNAAPAPTKKEEKKLMDDESLSAMDMLFGTVQEGLAILTDDNPTFQDLDSAVPYPLTGCEITFKEDAKDGATYYYYEKPDRASETNMYELMIESSKAGTLTIAHDGYLLLSTHLTAEQTTPVEGKQSISVADIEGITPSANSVGYFVDAETATAKYSNLHTPITWALCVLRTGSNVAITINSTDPETGKIICDDEDNPVEFTFGSGYQAGDKYEIGDDSSTLYISKPDGSEKHSYLPVANEDNFYRFYQWYAVTPFGQRVELTKEGTIESDLMISAEFRESGLVSGGSDVEGHKTYSYTYNSNEMEFRHLDPIVKEVDEILIDLYDGTKLTVDESGNLIAHYDSGLEETNFGSQYNETYTISAIPTTDYIFSAWNVDGVELTTESDPLYINHKDTITITPVYKENVIPPGPTPPEPDPDPDPDTPGGGGTVTPTGYSAGSKTGDLAWTTLVAFGLMGCAIAIAFGFGIRVITRKDD